MAKKELAKKETAKEEPAKNGSANKKIAKHDAAKKGPAEPFAAKQVSDKQVSDKQVSDKQGPGKQGPGKQGPEKKAPTKQDLSKKDLSKKDVSKKDVSKKDVAEKDATQYGVAPKEVETTPVKKASPTLTTSEIGDHLAATFDIPKSHAKIYLTEAVALIGKSLKKGNKVRISGLGVFQVKKRAARKGRNPNTGEPIKIKASKRVGFAVARDLKVKL